jgi:hypothetical protein
VIGVCEQVRVAVYVRDAECGASGVYGPEYGHASSAW